MQTRIIYMLIYNIMQRRGYFRNTIKMIDVYIYERLIGLENEFGKYRECMGYTTYIFCKCGEGVVICMYRVKRLWSNNV